jgi:hypothetical protein
MSQVQHDAELVAGLDEIATKRGQAFVRGPAGRENSAGPDCISSRVRESNRAHAQFEKNAQEIQVRPERLDSFHRNEERDLASRSRILDFKIASANRKAVGFSHLSLEQRNLIERDAQSHFRQIAVLDKNRHTKNDDLAGVEFRQEFRRQDIRAVALFVQIHEQVEMHIDQPRRMKAIDPLLDFASLVRHETLTKIDEDDQAMGGGMVVASGRFARY